MGVRYLYRVLGTTQALRTDGTAVPLGGARLRAVLTALALAGGGAVRTGQLAAAVWAEDEEAPADETAAVQALVGRLRRALGRDAVESVTGGYRLAASRDDIDLFRFERLAAEGAAALADGDPAKAADLLDDALALWRGPALADLPDGGGPAGIRAADRAVAARRDRARAALALGRAEEILPAVRELAAAHPLDEPLQALLIRALRETGRTAEALAVYEQVRSRIADRLGADPGTELRTLHAELLSGGPAPAPPGGPSPVLPGGPSPALSGGPFPAPSGGPAPAPSGGPFPEPPSGPAPAPPGGPAPATPGGPSQGPSSGPAPASPGGPASVPSGGPSPASSDGPAPASPGGPAPVPSGGETPASASAGAAAGRGAPPYAAGAGRVPAGARRPGNLRSMLTSFVGRDDELRAIGEELSASRLVTLTGPGGAGKTRLSLEAAALATERGATWSDGVWVAELAGVRGQNAQRETAEAVLTALGGRETVLTGSAAEGLVAATDPTAGDPLAQLAEHCAGRRILLVLDNCEHVIDAAARVAETLLMECPGVTVLATSREPLGVPGESVRPVEPLPDPVALRLLADRGAAARPGFRTEEDPEACAEICRRLDGLPLAIELAAARLRSLTPRQLASRLDRRFRLLTSGSRTVLPRQQTLRAVVDWSWELLDGPERAVLRRLAVFAGGCELEQVEEVCADLFPEAADAGGHDGTGGSAAAVLGSLVDKSLVVAVPNRAGAGTGMRYRLLETVAEYAAGKLDGEPGERERAERRHLVAYRELARTADPLLRGPQQAAWLDRLESEHDNIRTALRRAFAARDEQEMLCLVLSMGWFWQLRGHRSDAGAWAEATVTLGPDPFASPLRPARPVHEPCTAAPPPMTGEVLWEARRGVRLMVLADAEDGIDLVRRPARQAELRNVTRAYTPGMPQVCRLPGCMWLFAWMLTGDFAALKELCDAQVRACRELGYEWELAFALQLRSKLLSDRPGGWDQSGEDAAESLEIFRRAGDAWGEAEALSGRAEALAARGEFAEAATDYRMAIERAAQLGAHSQVPQLKSRLGAVLVELDDPAQAAEGDRLMREATEESEGLPGDGPNFAAVQLAVHLVRRGEPARAQELLEPLEARFEDKSPQLFAGMVQGIMAWGHLVAGRPADALAKLRVSIVRTREVLADAVTPHLTLSQLLTAAGALAGLGRGREAGRLLGAYDGLAAVPEGRFPHPLEREARQSAEKAVRELLSEREYADAHAEGDGLSIEEAVALVRNA
ncbi:BTAD domain-containing putative transcriptional regulator [Streptomyces albus]|uniref:BTAD domain-containing putative transcriptional regulator n=1 Tax=Streptomyces albus TaxID=1888 RepID=UPI00340DD763